MEIASFLLLLLAIVLSLLLLPTALAVRGIGSRWIWLGGGIGGLLVVILSSVAREMERRLSSSGVGGFDPVNVYYSSPSTLLGGADAFCFLLALGFLIAGICYKPKAKNGPNLLGKL